MPISSRMRNDLTDLINRILRDSLDPDHELSRLAMQFLTDDDYAASERRVEEHRRMQDAARNVTDPAHPVNRGDALERPTRPIYVHRTRRPTANLKYTLGWELEANRAPHDDRIPDGIAYHEDGSVNGDSAEFVVLPAITRSPRYVMGLLKDLVHKPGLNTDDSCGFHVHVSAAGLTARRMRDWAIATEFLAKKIEDQAFKAVPDSRQGNQYCRPIVPLAHGTEFFINKYDNGRRYHWLNTVEMFRPGGIRTMEIRLLGHTHRWKYLSAWVLFCMELARRGWLLNQKPFDCGEHVKVLTDILGRIEKEIKPLNRRHEPVPQWVYAGLETFDMPASSWGRPLSKLTETEANLKGLILPAYSDDQPEIENDEDMCPCDCGTEGRCDWQICEDGDCDQNDCERCHENGNCDGEGSCYYCDGGNRRRRARPTVAGTTTGRVTATPSGSWVTMPTLDQMARVNNIVVTSDGTVPPPAVAGTSNVPASTQPLDPIRIREAMQFMDTVRVAPSNPFYERRMVDVMLYGSGVAPVTWIDEAANVQPYEMEGRGRQMLDAHEEALSVNREVTYHSERPSMGFCDGTGCGMYHNDNDICAVCQTSWGEHNGHTCPRMDTIGSFPTIGGR